MVKEVARIADRLSIVRWAKESLRSILLEP